MPDQPLPTQSPAPVEAENYQDYAGALQTIASARSLFLLLLLLSLLTHVGLYSVARWKPQWVGLTPPTAEAAPAEGEADEQPLRALAEAGGEATIDPAARGWPALEALLPVSAFIGLASGILLLFCYLLSVNVALSGRLGGVRDTLAALIWMAVVLLLMLPWGAWFGSWGIQIPGVYVTAEDVVTVPTQFDDRTAEVIHNVRYLGYPLLVLVIAVVGDRRYARGYRLAGRQIESRLAVRRIRSQGESAN